MYRNGINQLGIKLPRKVKKVYLHRAPERSYKRIFNKMRYSTMHYDHNRLTFLHKLIDYLYCYDERDRGYRASWPEVVNHRLYKVVQKHPKASRYGKEHNRQVE